MRKPTTFNARLMLLCVSAAYVVVGTVLLTSSAISMQSICAALGIILMAVGVVNILWYFLKKGYLTPGRLGFAAGMGEFLLGAFALMRTDEGASAILLILAICILADSLLKLQYSMDLLRLKFQYWWVALLLALVATALGMAALTYPFGDEVFRSRFTYISLIIDAVINVVLVVCLQLSYKKLAKENQLSVPKDSPKGDAPQAAEAPTEEEA